MARTATAALDQKYINLVDSAVLLAHIKFLLFQDKTPKSFSAEALAWRNHTFARCSVKLLSDRGDGAMTYGRLELAQRIIDAILQF